MKKSLFTKCSRIKLVLTDVDGVLTDGGMYYTADGDIMKKFHVRDGMGVTLLRKNNIDTIIVTKEKTKMVKQWARKMKVKKLYDGIIQKEVILNKICKEYNISPQEIAYIADDVNDLELLKKVGFAVTPNDGIKHAKKICDYVCKSRSGEGAFRELVDLILSNTTTQK
jgi:3-deoxy-D-manno-octulosonate 8-phosphate phosphatase (KDO 8-P phosphatase)